MTELGNRLRTTREEKGITLDELQTITKIQKKYLVGIEEGNYDVMPGKFYARAFIKQYAEAVGLEPEQIFDEFNKEIPAAYEDDLPEQLSRVQSRGGMSGSNSKLIELTPKILAAVFVVAALFVIWLAVTKFYDKDSKPSAQNGNEPVEFRESDEVKTPEKQPEVPKEEDEEKNTDGDQGENVEKEEPKQTITMSEVNPEGTTYAVSGAKQFQLKVNAVPNGRSWVRIKNGGDETLFEGELTEKNGQTFDLSAEPGASIRVGSAPNVEILVNDEKLQYELDPAKNNVQNIYIQYNQ